MRLFFGFLADIVDYYRDVYYWNGKRMIYSYSSLNCYENCPKQFFHRYIARDALPYQGVEAEAGTKVHEAIETALKTRQPLPKHMEVYETTISSVRGKINNARIEQTIYLDKSFQYALTKPSAGFVVKLDVLLLSDDGTRAVVMDWKTGKPREDTLQHDCYALGVMRAFPDVLHVTGFNVYLKIGKIGRQLEYARENIQVQQDEIARRIAVIEADQRYAPKPSPLCHWCSAHKCKYYPKDK
jgi:hypothetical protein